jgi:hypothetical protein
LNRIIKQVMNCETKFWTIKTIKTIKFLNNNFPNIKLQQISEHKICEKFPNTKTLELCFNFNNFKSIDKFID